MSKEFRISVAVYAVSDFIWELPKNYKNMSKDALLDDFYDNAEPIGGICNRCTDTLQTDFDIVDADDTNEFILEQIESIIENE